VQVSRASNQDVPPSSLRLWRKVLRNADAVYLGDFDTAFEDKFFWSYKDTGKVNFSHKSIGRAGLLLASTLRLLAGGNQPQRSAEVRF
jgi:Nicastrin